MRFGGSTSASTAGVPACIRRNGEQKRWKRATSNDATETAPWMDSALGVLLDGFAVKKKRKPPKTSRTQKTPSAPLVRGRVVRRRF
ncbi:MAG: hypothetical protein IKW80_03005 [Thermoguttaceae bacterium]|nr:hypothetical protein [Thermoguttaceae bacterium]